MSRGYRQVRDQVSRQVSRQVWHQVWDQVRRARKNRSAS